MCIFFEAHNTEIHMKLTSKIHRLDMPQNFFDRGICSKKLEAIAYKE